GMVSRISPEAPVPVLDKKTSDFRLGGAGNVALNIAALGAIPIMVSVIGQDSAGKEILKLMADKNISTSCLALSSKRKTTVKTRVVANNQQVIRIDEEQTDDISDELVLKLLSLVEKELTKGLTAIIFEDYNKGVLTEKLIISLIEFAQKHGIITSVDPKKKNFFAYRGVTLFKPNLKELREGLNIAIDPSNPQSVHHASSLLEKKLGNRLTLVTLSEHGVSIKDSEKQFYLGAHRRTIADVSGAGDTVIATATLCLAAGATTSQIAEIANIAGGLACEKAGVSTLTLAELQSECHRLHKNKV
ncbi:MAG: D-glycero-beta-D-manno-heptose-7-phosphate kinase, partial [Bacteroidetes bacterium]|nr:D-glycero-beta-D-manno-heptose-7-phosphate kinase [Bacteroidota bacterium]